MQWSSGGGGGGGLGGVKQLAVQKGVDYKVVVGVGGQCGTNAGNNRYRGEEGSRDAGMGGGTSYFKDNKTVAGFGAGRGGPHSTDPDAGLGGTSYFKDNKT